MRFSLSRKNRKGLSLIETMIIVGVVSIVGMFSVPLFQQLEFRNDLNLSRSQVLQGLETAKQYAVAGKDDTVWSFYIPAGVIFPGTDYNAAMNDPALEAKSIHMSMPSTVRYHGIDLVTYDRSGKPSIEGTIDLGALNNESQQVALVIAISPGTVTTYEPSGSSSSSSSADSSSSSSSSDSSSSSSSSSSVDNFCPYFNMGDLDLGWGAEWMGKKITVTQPAQFTIDNIAALRLAPDNNYIPTLYCYLENAHGPDNPSWFDFLKVVGMQAPTNMFASLLASAGGGSPDSCQWTAQDPMPRVNPGGGDSKHVPAVESGTLVGMMVNDYWYQEGYLSVWDSYYTIYGRNGHFWYLRNGDSVAPDGIHTNSSALKDLLVARGLADAQGTVTMNACDLILAAEMENVDPATADFTDGVMRMSFAAE